MTYALGLQVKKCIDNLIFKYVDHDNRYKSKVKLSLDSERELLQILFLFLSVVTFIQAGGEQEPGGRREAEARDRDYAQEGGGQHFNTYSHEKKSQNIRPSKVNGTISKGHDFTRNLPTPL